MTNSIRRDAIISTELARRSALKAVSAFDRMEAPRSQHPPAKNKDRFAQNTWGVLTVCCLIAAIGFSFLPEIQDIKGILTEKAAVNLAVHLPVEVPSGQTEKEISSNPVIVIPSNNQTPDTSFSELEQNLELHQTAKNIPSPLEVANLPVPLPVDPVVTSSINDSILNTTDLDVFREPQFPDTDIGVDIGGGIDLESLEFRYHALKSRAPDLFAGLRPIVQGDEKGTSGQSRLIVGPFKNKDHVSSFCRALRLRLTIDCTQALYDGSALGLTTN